MKIGWWEKLVRRVMRMPIPKQIHTHSTLNFYDGTTEAVALGIIFQKALDNGVGDG